MTTALLILERVHVLAHVGVLGPGASDVPDALRIQAAGNLATHNHRCFLVDSQLPNAPDDTEVATGICTRRSRAQQRAFSPRSDLRHLPSSRYPLDYLRLLFLPAL